MKCTFKGFSVDTKSRELKKGSKEIPLYRTEFDLLAYLCANKGLALSKAQITQDVWGADYLGTERSVDTHICQLRKKLGSAGKCIKTLYTVGYKFKP